MSRPRDPIALINDIRGRRLARAAEDAQAALDIARAAAGRAEARAAAEDDAMQDARRMFSAEPGNEQARIWLNQSVTRRTEAVNAATQARERAAQADAGVRVAVAAVLRHRAKTDRLIDRQAARDRAARLTSEVRAELDAPTLRALQ